MKASMENVLNGDGTELGLCSLERNVVGTEKLSKYPHRGQSGNELECVSGTCIPCRMQAP